MQKQNSATQEKPKDAEAAVQPKAKKAKVSAAEPAVTSEKEKVR